MDLANDSRKLQGVHYSWRGKLRKYIGVLGWDQ